MSKKASRQLNFMKFAAQFSERMKANGGFVGVASPELFADLKTQYRTIRKRITELDAKEHRSPEEQRELHNHIRVIGDWSKLLRKCGQVAFENAFVIVAHARLPREHFLIISAEARAIWNEVGYADDLPIPAAKMRKAYRRLKRQDPKFAKSLQTNYVNRRTDPSTVQPSQPHQPSSDP